MVGGGYHEDPVVVLEPVDFVEEVGARVGGYDGVNVLEDEHAGCHVAGFGEDVADVPGSRGGFDVERWDGGIEMRGERVHEGWQGSSKMEVERIFLGDIPLIEIVFPFPAGPWKMTPRYHSGLACFHFPIFLVKTAIPSSFQAAHRSTLQ